MNSLPTTSKLLLVAGGRGAGDGGPGVPVRRYRLARIVAAKSEGEDKRVEPRRG